MLAKYAKADEFLAGIGLNPDTHPEEGYQNFSSNSTAQAPSIGTFVQTSLLAAPEDPTTDPVANPSADPPTDPAAAPPPPSGSPGQSQLDKGTARMPLRDFISGQLDVEYYGPLSFGTPAQVLDVDIDTGSADLWVPARCASCPQDEFEPQTSSSFRASTTKCAVSYVRPPLCLLDPAHASLCQHELTHVPGEGQGRRRARAGRRVRGAAERAQPDVLRRAARVGRLRRRARERAARARVRRHRRVRPADVLREPPRREAARTERVFGASDAQARDGLRGEWFFFLFDVVFWFSVPCVEDARGLMFRGVGLAGVFWVLRRDEGAVETEVAYGCLSGEPCQNAPQNILTHLSHHTVLLVHSHGWPIRIPDSEHHQVGRREPHRGKPTRPELCALGAH